MTSPIPRILSWTRRHRLAVTIVSLALAGVSAFGMRQLTFDTDVLSLLPRDGRVIPAFRTFVQQFGSLDQLYIVFSAPDGYSIADYDDEVNAWIRRLRETPEIARVDTGLFDRSRDLSWLADRQLLLLDNARLDRALSRFRLSEMQRALASGRELLTVPSAHVADLVRNDPLGFYELVREQLGGTQAGVNLGAAEGGYVTPDGRRRLIVAQPLRPPYDADFSRALMSRLDALRLDLKSDAGPDDDDDRRPPMQVEFAGGHRIAVETEAVVRRESITNTVGSLALILPLLFFVFRSPWLVVIGALPAGLSLLIVLGVLGASGATLSAAATASAAMLFGLGVDGVVLLYVAHTLALARNEEPAAAIDRLAGPASSMLLGMWTTAATFYGLLFVDFPSLEQLGALIGHSMVLCGIFTLLLVAAWLPRGRPRRPLRALTMPRLAAWVERRSTAILASALVATAVLGLAATGVRVNPTLDRLRSVTPGAVYLQSIGPSFNLPDDVHVVLTEGSDLQQLLASNEALVDAIGRAVPAVAVQAPTMLLPPERTQARRAQRIAGSNLSPAKVAEVLAHAADAEGFRIDALDPFRERLPRLLDTEQRLTYDGYMMHGLGDLIGRFIARSGEAWRLVTYTFPATEREAAAVQRAVQEVAPSATVTGLPLVNRELAERFVPQFLKGLTIGTAVVFALVLAAFRSWRLSLLSLAPTAIGLIWAAGALALARVELDLFALFAVVTFIGIGVDYGIHLVHRYQEHGHARRAIEELSPVILVAGAITLLGYGTLVTSSYPPLRSIGVVSVASVIALAAASLLVLPAMLSCRIGSRD